MNVKFLLLCLAVMMMAATESTNAYRKREWRKRHEDIDPEMLEGLERFWRGLEQLAKTLEEDIGEGRR